VLLKLRSREMVMMEKKNEMESKKAAVQLNLLMIQEKEQLLLTRKRLMDAGISIMEIDKILPLNN
jgi:hypothetical protein